MKGINIFLADGFEDVEALGTNDVLKRGGVRTSLIAISDDPFVVSSHGITVGIDSFLSDSDTDGEGTTLRDVMIFPGGMPGSKNLAACKPLIKAMKAHYEAGGTVAAICAAPGLVRPDRLLGRESIHLLRRFCRHPVQKGRNVRVKARNHGRTDNYRQERGARSGLRAGDSQARQG